MKIRHLIFVILLLGSLRVFAAEISVMMPLNPIQDWNLFRRQLKTLKEAGVSGVTTDVWWGHFEARGDNQFDWDYYRYYAQVVWESGLKWTPIISFHQCGGNVGDDCNIPLPAWLWRLADSDEMAYRDRNGKQNFEYIAPWFEGAYQQYEEALQSFAINFKSFSPNIPKVYLSLGPAGELRYPSYNAAAGWHYPEPGSFQSYSKAALRDFQDRMRMQYGGNLSWINSAWNTSLLRFEDIDSPRDGDRFFVEGVKTQYGRDFLTWYQASLLRHLDRMKRIASHTILQQMPVDIGAKVSGVHWQYLSQRMPHAAEYAAGYLNYDTIVREFARTRVDLTFTCLEMNDNPGHPAYSSPQGIVREVSTYANKYGVKINGENALPIHGSWQAYENIRRNLAQYNYAGFTLLRLQNVVDASGYGTEDLGLFRDIVIRNQGFLDLPLFPNPTSLDPFWQMIDALPR